MARTEEVDREELINAIWRARGKVSAVAVLMGVSAKTVRNYATKYTTVRAAIDDARTDWDEQLLDVAESKLYDEVKEGRPWAIKYALATKGRSRGYVERQEHEVSGPGGGAVGHEVKLDFSDDAREVILSQLARIADTSTTTLDC